MKSVDLRLQMFKDEVALSIHRFSNIPYDLTHDQIQEGLDDLLTQMRLLKGETK